MARRSTPRPTPSPKPTCFSKVKARLRTTSSAALTTRHCQTMPSRPASSTLCFNIRRWIIENDWLEAIVALPLNMFYNTPLATYIWVLTNRKPDHRRGKVQLIDATSWFKPLRKNLGKKNCELSGTDIKIICDTFLAFEETE